MMSDFLTLQYSEEEADIVCLSPFINEYLTVLNVCLKNQNNSGEQQIVVRTNGSDISMEDLFSDAFNLKLGSIIQSFQNHSGESQSIKLLSQEIEFLLRDEFNKVNTDSEKCCDKGRLTDKIPILDVNAFEDLELIGWDKFFDLSADLSTLTLKLFLSQCDDPESIETSHQNFPIENFESYPCSSHYFEIRKTFLKTKKLAKSDMNDDGADYDVRDSWKYSVSCSTIPRSYEPSQNIQTLSELYEDFRNFVDQFTFLWKSFQEIDEKFWVIDPEVISPIHLHRRVMMRNAVSVHIEFIQSELSGIPSVSFLGPPLEVSKLKNRLNSNIANWNINGSVLQNIYNILEIDESSLIEKIEKMKRPFAEISAVNEPFLDVRCQICLSIGDFNEEIVPENDGEYVSVSPEAVCSNSKCAKRYHSSCIKNWFLSLPKIRKSFNTLFGPCPICKSDICVKI